ncbi:chromate transporter [Paracidovorax cattleyae]
MPSPAAEGVHPSAVSLPEALRFWLKPGFIGFGGPAGQIAPMHDELVDRRRWISEKRFLHALNCCMLLPGPGAQQLATYLGWLLHRTWGGILAGVLFVLPSLFILVALAWLYMAHGDAPAVAGVFHGIQPAVTGIVAQAALRIGGGRCAAAGCGPSPSRRSSRSSPSMCRSPPSWRPRRRRAAPGGVRCRGGHRRPLGNAQCAVLPYVYQGAVEHFQWITPAQMMDGLALGETTPGPLIMVVTFFTFLPSFVFMLPCGPFIGSTRGNLRLAAPLAGIAAAVVGVIANLAVIFALHVFWPQGLHAGPDMRMLLIGAASAVALMRWRVGVIPVILAAGLAGLAMGL